MKLHVLSDLHLEFADFELPLTDADVVVLAGDIGVGTDGVRWAARTFPDRPVAYVPGNHEFYDRDIDSVAAMEQAAAENVHVLNNREVIIDGVRFLGSTLWTDFAFYGEADQEVLEDARRFVRDFSAIRKGDESFAPEDSIALHEEARDWLDNRLDDHFDGDTVVVTHHLPAAASTAGPYAKSRPNPAFASRLEVLIERHAPALWIHGHTHVPCDYRLAATRVVCNPRGYPRESYERRFDPGLVVRI